MPSLKEMLNVASAIDRRIESKKRTIMVSPEQMAAIEGQEAEKPAAGPAESELPASIGIDSPTYAVYKVSDGQRAERASKVGLSKDEADQYIAERPDNIYDVVAEK